MNNSLLKIIILMFVSSFVMANQEFDATSYEVMHNCFAQAESMTGSADLTKNFILCQ